MNKSQGRRSFSNVGINSPSFLWLYLNILHFFLLSILSWKWNDICFTFLQQSWLFSTNIFCATVFPRSVNFISIEYLLLPSQKVDLDFFVVTFLFIFYTLLTEWALQEDPLSIFTLTWFIKKLLKKVICQLYLVEWELNGPNIINIKSLVNLT